MTDEPIPQEEPLRRACRRARDVLDRQMAHPRRWSPTAWRTRRHLARCPACAEVWADHQALEAGMADVVAVPATAVPDEPVGATPPDGLLEGLLAQASDDGLRARAAVPMRGAVSGARPGLTVTLLVFACLVGLAAAYGTWRATKVLRR